MSGPVPGAPSDNTTLVAVLAAFEAKGFVAQLTVTPDGLVECSACGEQSAPGRLSATEIRRLEGASDPADMVAVVATSCPNCQGDGTIVMGYGANASEGDQAVALAFRDRRADH